jgi:hypothetical protein
VRFNAVILSIFLLALASCEEFGANAVDGSHLTLKEGDVLVYEDLEPQSFFFGPVIPDADRAEYRLISTIATIGGRENVRAFEFSRDRSIVFSENRDGRLWQAFTAAEPGMPVLDHAAVWLRIPKAGEEPVSGTVTDRAYFDDTTQTTVVSRTVTITPLESVRFYAGGYHFPATKVRIDFDISNQSSIHRETEEVTYLETLGIIGERSFMNSSSFNSSRILLERIDFKD